MAKKNKKPVSFDFSIMDASSSTECTGVTPRPPLSDNELESYQNIVSFGAPKVTKKAKDK